MKCFSCQRILPEGAKTVQVWSHETVSNVDICTTCHEFSLRWNKLNPPGSFNNSAIHAKAENDLLAEWKEAISQEFSL